MTRPSDEPDDNFFEVTLHSVRDARAALSALPLDDELRQRATLVLSELATNAVLHAGSPFVVRVWSTGESVRLEVEDSSPRLPMITHESTMSGRGLSIVEALSRSWGAERRGTGKVVWADVD